MPDHECEIECIDGNNTFICILCGIIIICNNPINDTDEDGIYFSFPPN